MARQITLRHTALGMRMIQKATSQVLIYHKGTMDLQSLDAIVCMLEALMSGLKPEQFQAHASVSCPCIVVSRRYLGGVFPSQNLRLAVW